MQKISIPLGNKAPSYGMTVSTVTESAYTKTGEFRFRIINNSTKDVVIDDTSYDTILLDDNNRAGFKDVYFDDKDVVLEKTAGTFSGRKTAVVNVVRKNWDSEFLKTYPVSYKFTVNYVDKQPVAKISNSTVEINTWFTGVDGEAEISLDQQNSYLRLRQNAGSYFTYVGTDKMYQDSRKIIFSVVPVPN